MKRDNKEVINQYELAKSFETQIKDVVVKKFSISIEDLELLLEYDGGVYLSKEESNTLCCFVVGKKSGFLYLVTGKIEDKEKLIDFKSDIIS